MAEPKTKATKASATSFLNAIPDQTRRADCFAVSEMMREITKEEPVMWGSTIVGFGRYRQEYQGGREGEWPIAAFSPRKGDLTLYLTPGFESDTELMERLGKYKTGKTCLYIKKLADVDPKVLKQLIAKSVKKMSSQRIKS
ncbi:MAG TPA: DUF1801 domain-containing protein [Pyrinomonadaceae bacterium]|nr:DUF1801 domain-containing protein [Pyrinomonadaceae bacterium]